MNASTPIHAEVFARNRRRFRVGSYGLFAVGVGVVGLTLTGRLAPLGLTPAAAGYVFLAFTPPLALMRRAWWRCPACAQDLGRDLDPGACGQCGVRLREAPANPVAPARTGPEVAREFARRTRRQWLLFGVGGPVVMGVIALRTAWERLPGAPPVALWVVLFVGALGALMLAMRQNWRCPACERPLGRNGTVRHCPSCGVRLLA